MILICNFIASLIIIYFNPRMSFMGLLWWHNI
jgi:hypothetical protein